MNIALLTSLIGIVGFGLTVVCGMAIEHRQKRQNYDALLQNKAFVESQINCVLGRGHCDRIGSRIKVLVPEVVKSSVCTSCTEDERDNVQKVAEHVENHYPKSWNEIKDFEDEEVENSVSTESSSTIAPSDTENDDSDTANKEDDQETAQNSESQKNQSVEQEETLNQDQEQKAEETSEETPKKENENNNARN
ncbi:hypothetical protein CHUAL_000919 [Chamberlinius hualienensis]